MALPHTTVKFRLFNADGSVAVGLSVVAKLTHADTDAGAVVPDRVVRGASDLAGECLLDLWPNARGTTGSQYQVSVIRNGMVADEFTITVPESVSVVLAESIKSAPPYPSVSVGQQLLEDAQQAVIDAGNASRLTIGTVTTLDPGTPAEATITGAPGSQALNLGIPRGEDAIGAGAGPEDLAINIHGATSKTTPVDADELPIADSAATFGLKKLTWGNLKAALKAYLDTLYQAVLEAGVNIKTINGVSPLGAGDLTINSTPGGTNGQLQVNNSGAFDGLTSSSYSGAQLSLGDTLTLAIGSIKSYNLLQLGNILSGYTFVGGFDGAFHVSDAGTSSTSFSVWTDTNNVHGPSLPKNSHYSWSSTTSANGLADLGLNRVAAGLLGVNTGVANSWASIKAKDVIATGVVSLASFTVAGLPSAATSGAGAKAYVTDAASTTYGAIVAGSGSNKVGVTSNGTDWLIDSSAGGLAQNSQSSDYTSVLADANSVIYHPAADTTARTWTIPANASVAFPIGTCITFDNDFGAGAITISITSDTLVLVGDAGSTGSRTLASGGQATAIKVSSTRWRINGMGLT